MIYGLTTADLLIIGIDALVLLVIVLEWTWSYRRERAKDKQAEKQAKVVAVISDFMFKGHALAGSVPNPEKLHESNDWGPAHDWEGEVEVWRTEVAQFLSSRSGTAASVFLLVTAPNAVVCTVHPLEQWSFRLHGRLREVYQELQGYLDNLRSIMEKPDAYF